MTASGGAPGGGEYSLGTAVLRLYGDRSALDKELEVLRRYTERLEKQGVKVKFDGDTGALTREVNGLQQMLLKAKETMQSLGQGMAGDGNALKGLSESLGKLGAGQGGAAGAAAAGLSGVAKAAGVAIPLLGQVGLAVMGLEGIFKGAGAAINAFLGPLKQLSAESVRFNQQVAQGGIFAANSFGIFGPDGKVVQGTANQMRAVRGVITKEYGEIQKEVAKISGATASEIYEGFNIILQNIDSLGEKGTDLSNVTKLSTRLAAGMNTLGIPGQQLSSEVNSLLTGDIQMYDQLAQKLGISRDDVQQQQAAGTYYDFLIEKLDKLYDGQKVLASSLPNVQSNFTDLFQTISSQGGQALERGLAGGLQMVLTTLTNLQESFTMLFRSISEALEPILVVFGQVGAALTSVGSVVSSLLSMVVTTLGTALNLVGSLLSGGLQVLVRTLEVIAKTVEVVAEAFNRGMRIISTFFRILNRGGTNAVDSQFDKLIGGLDAFADWIEKNQRRMLDPWIAMTQAIIQARGFLQGLPQKEIDQQKSIARTEFLSSFNTSDEYDLKPLNLSRKSEQFLDELRARTGGSGSGQRNIEYAKQASKIKEDMYRNEIKALQQGVELMQRQKQLVEAINQLSEARRNLTMQSFNLATQVAASPEAKAAAEGRRDDQALQQEQQRIRERVSLLATEKQMMAAQLEIQTRQVKIDQEQLKIKRLEQQIEVDKARAVSTELVQKLRNVAPGSAQQRTYQQSFRDVNRELEYRQQIMRALDRSVSLSYEQEAVNQKIFGIDMQRLDTQEQMLGVQADAANYTREQQRLLAQIQAEELRIKNALDEKVLVQTKLQDAANGEIQKLQDQQKSQDELLKIEKARADLGATRAKAATEEAERMLGAVSAQDQARQGGSTRELIEAQIRAAAAGVNATETATSAAERLYDAKERQMRMEQESQQRAQQIQQERERSEQRIAQLRMQVDLATAEIQLLQLAAARENLQLRGQRDALSRSVAGNASVPYLDESLRGATGEGRALAATAQRLGVDPLDLGAIIGFETGGKFSAGTPGIGAAEGRLGLIQFGANERAQYGASAGQSFEEQLGAVERYLKDRFSKVGKSTQGAGLLDLYTAVNQGSPEARLYDSRDGNKITPRSVIPRIEAYRSTVQQRFFGGGLGQGGPDVPSAPIRPPANLGPLPAGSNAMGLQKGGEVPFGAVPIGVTPFTGGQGSPESLQNELDSNTSQMDRLSENINRLRKQFEVLMGARAAQLDTRQALDSENLSESQAAQNRAFQFERQVDLAKRRILDTPQGRTAAATADSVGTAIRGGVGGSVNALAFGGDPREALKQALQGLASEVLNTAIKALLDPFISQLQGMIFSALTGFNPASVTLQAAGTSLNIAAQALMGAASANFSGQPLKGAGLINDIFGGGAGMAGFGGLTGVFSSAATTAFDSGAIVKAAFGGIGFLSKGGPVSAGKPYFVGDNPDGSLNSTSELFIPGRSGTIIPASDTIAAAREAMAGEEGGDGADNVLGAARGAMMRGLSNSERATMEQRTSSETTRMMTAMDRPLRLETFSLGSLNVVTQEEAAQLGKEARKGAVAEVFSKMKNQRSVPGLRG